MPKPPVGHVDMTQAAVITGYSKRSLYRAVAAGEVPGAFQRTAHGPWVFTVEGLQRWMRGDTQPERQAS